MVNARSHSSSESETEGQERKGNFSYTDPESMDGYSRPGLNQLAMEEKCRGPEDIGEHLGLGKRRWTHSQSHKVRWATRTSSKGADSSERVPE